MLLSRTGTLWLLAVACSSGKQAGCQRLIAKALILAPTMQSTSLGDRGALHASRGSACQHGSSPTTLSKWWLPKTLQTSLDKPVAAPVPYARKFESPAYASSKFR